MKAGRRFLKIAIMRRGWSCSNGKQRGEDFWKLQLCVEVEGCSNGKHLKNVGSDGAAVVEGSLGWQRRCG